MATSSAEILNVGRVPGSFALFADRWIYVSMAGLFIAVVLAGFVPHDIAILRAVQAHQRPPLPAVEHLHGAIMAVWLLLLLAQTALMANGRRRLHQSLGMVSVAVAPAMVASMIAVATLILSAAIAASATPAGRQTLGVATAFIAFVPFRSVILFSLFFVWAFRTRRTAPEVHKRMMILATWSLVDASLGRIHWLPTLGMGNYDPDHLYMLLLLVPVILYELLRFGRIHRAYVTGVGFWLPFVIATHVLMPNPPWWQRLVVEWLGKRVV